MKFDSRAGELAGQVGVTFDDISVLEMALAHRSWCAENAGTASNERLEFLGDAVLGLIVTNHLFKSYPDFPEGELAKVRAAVVSSASLAEIATELDLGSHLLLGKGENRSGGREKRSILADAFEAVIGATYLGNGWDTAERLVLALFGDRMAEAAMGPGGKDYKTRLQELTVRVLEDIPRYEVSDDGPDHSKHFTATVSVTGVVYGTGIGGSKKRAEQAAAEAALNELHERPPAPVHGGYVAPGNGGYVAPGNGGYVAPGNGGIVYD